MKTAAELLLSDLNVDAAFRQILAGKPLPQATQSDLDAMTAAERDQQAEKQSPEAFK